MIGKTEIITCHDLKIWPEHFELVNAQSKGFEVRKDDRGYRVDDRLNLREWDPKTEKFTGRVVVRFVGFIHRGLGMKPGYVVLQFQ